MGKCDPSTESGAERHEHGLHCDKPAREVLDRVAPVAKLIKIHKHETSREKGFLRMIVPLPHLDRARQAAADNDHEPVNFELRCLACKPIWEVVSLTK